MTVLFVGVGADSTNTGPHPPVHPDGTFEYVPIPEVEPRSAEVRTYGSERLRYAPGSMASFVEWISPGADGHRIDDRNAIAVHPLHYDPDFSALTYGESGSRPDYVAKLMALEHGDILAFYAGLDDGSSIHRYVIGYFTVARVVNTKGETNEDRRKLFANHPENAHTKRFFGPGASQADEIALVDGREPGGLLARVGPQLSVYRSFDGNARSQYYLDDAFARQFRIDDPTFTHDPDASHKDAKTYLGIKPALVADLDAREFLNRVGPATPR